MAWALHVHSVCIHICQHIFCVCGCGSTCKFVSLWVMATLPLSLSPWMELSVGESLSCCGDVNVPSLALLQLHLGWGCLGSFEPQSAPGPSRNSVLPVGRGAKVGGGAQIEAFCPPGP